jgi:putative transposase
MRYSADFNRLSPLRQTTLRRRLIVAAHCCHPRPQPTDLRSAARARRAACLRRTPWPQASGAAHAACRHRGTPPQRYWRTTIGDPFTVLPGLVQRDFTATCPDQLWVGDITYVRTWEGWLYLATILDCFSRRVVGWAMADHLRTELPLNALHMAQARRNPAGTLIHHTDRGCQYTSEAYTNVLESHGIRSSLSRPGNCWDNAVAESFFSTLKLDLLYRHSWPTRAAARSAIFEYIEAFYNRERRHSTLGNLSPADYESQHAAVCSA